jgi:hypothetical protein
VHESRRGQKSPALAVVLSRQGSPRTISTFRKVYGAPGEETHRHFALGAMISQEYFEIRSAYGGVPGFFMVRGFGAFARTVEMPRWRKNEHSTAF